MSRSLTLLFLLAALCLCGLPAEAQRARIEALERATGRGGLSAKAGE